MTKRITPPLSESIIGNSSCLFHDRNLARCGPGGETLEDERAYCRRLMPTDGAHRCPYDAVSRRALYLQPVFGSPDLSEVVESLVSGLTFDILNLS